MNQDTFTKHFSENVEKLSQGTRMTLTLNAGAPSGFLDILNNGAHAIIPKLPPTADATIHKQNGVVTINTPGMTIADWDEHTGALREQIWEAFRNSPLAKEAGTAEGAEKKEYAGKGTG